MLRISISYFYRLGGVMQTLTGVHANMKLGDAWPALNSARTELQTLFGADWFFHAVRAAYNPGDKLLKNITPLVDRTDWDSPLTALEAFYIQDALKEFETVVTNELLNTDSYFVTRKAGYDTSSLIGNAERCFPGGLAVKVPKAIPDIREAGKCLAFELSTASGFHVLRGMETVVHAYWTAASGGKAQPRPKTLGVYIKQLTKYGYGSPKVIAALQQIKDLHRNPLIHPEVTIDLDEAVSLFGMCNSAISAMLKEIPAPIPAASPQNP